MTAPNPAASAWGGVGGRRAAWLLGTAAAVAGTAMLVQTRARRAEREHPPTGSFIEVDGVRLHYLDRGEGSAIVLLHGNGAFAEDFAISTVLDRLAGHHRVVAFDRPGFGYSERPRSKVWTPRAQAALLHAAIQQLGVEQAVVVGHSFGTLVALALALDYPQSVRSLVLLSGYYFPTARADVAFFSPPAIPVLGDVMRYTISPVAGELLAPRIIRRVFEPSPVPPGFAAFPVGLSLRPSQLRAGAEDAAFMIPAAAQLSRRYGELAMPIVIAAGTGDKIADFDRQSARLHHTLAGSELRAVEGVGHMIHHIAAAEVADAIGKAALHLPATQVEGRLARV